MIPLLLWALYATVPLPVVMAPLCEPRQYTESTLLPSGRIVTCVTTVGRDCQIVKVCV